jgi:hypothetical protein
VTLVDANRRQYMPYQSFHGGESGSIPLGSAITFQTLSKPKATIFMTQGNHFRGPSSIRCIVRKTDIRA